MPKMTPEQACAARELAIIRYRNAVSELRAARGQLGALDILISDRPCFGPPPAVVEFRHAIANPDEGGNLQDDLMKIVQSTRVEG